MALRVIWQYMDRSVTKKILYGQASEPTRAFSALTLNALCVAAITNFMWEETSLLSHLIQLMWTATSMIWPEYSMTNDSFSLDPFWRLNRPCALSHFGMGTSYCAIFLDDIMYLIGHLFEIDKKLSQIVLKKQYVLVLVAFNRNLNEW
jgi:hypothetical protein